jgi:thiol-disulfide isomerase/thioredoxin
LIRLLVPAVASTFIAAALHAQTAPPAPPEAPTAPQAPANPAPPTAPLSNVTVPAEAATAEAKAKADAMLEALAKAYSSAPTIHDSVKVSVKGFSPGRPPQSQEAALTLAIGSGEDLLFEMPPMKVTSLNGTLYVEIESSPRKYLATPIDTSQFASPATTAPASAPEKVTAVDKITELLGDYLPPFPHFRLRNAKSREDALQAMSMKLLTDIKVAGATADTLYLTGAEGAMKAQVDPETNLLSALAVEFSPQMAPPGTRIDFSFEMDPTVAPALEKPIAFDPAGRKEVATLEALDPAVVVGDMAPEFTLSTLDGKSVTLADLKGSVVVLDFWATWCGPCRQGMPDIQKFHDWAKESGKPVHVYAVNVMENGDAAMRQKAASEYWTSQKFTLPSLIDLDDKVIRAYGFGGIPTTVIIDATGKIAKIHNGINPSVDTVELLKQETLEVLGEKS